MGHNWSYCGVCRVGVGVMISVYRRGRTGVLDRELDAMRHYIRNLRQRLEKVQENGPDKP